MSPELPRIEHPLKPIYDKASKILILGSFPSVKTREAAFFYGHPQNRFWPLISALMAIDPPLKASDPERARRLLAEKKIALWDTIYACRIKGSSDASIREVEPTDLAGIVRASSVRHVFCNGATSYKYYKKYHDEKIGLPVTKLPSTSPANAAWSFERLLQDWQIVADVLNGES